MTTNTLLDGLILIQLNGKTDTYFEHWNGELQNWTQNLRIWGESGVVDLKNKLTPKLTPKLENPGEVCMFVGYYERQNYGVYRMWNETTNGIHVSRYFVWSKQMFFAKKEEWEYFFPNLLLLKSIPSLKLERVTTIKNWRLIRWGVKWWCRWLWFG